jgi:glycosyltransferase involved in cell wall biosynthesis
MAHTSYQDSRFCDYAEDLVWREPPNKAELIRRVDEFAPDVVIMGSWTRPSSYRAVLKAQPPGVQRVMVTDTQWHGTAKQWLARALHRVYLDPVFDCALVPSDRSEWFVRRLGFKADQVIRGLYTADADVYAGDPRSGDDIKRSARFLFVGRLIAEKGVDVLAPAYRRYRELVDDPWDLDIVGIGPLRGELEDLEGVTLHGFLQPAEVAELMRRVSCLVLPSRFDPYGLVVHEAACAALPLLVSDACGAHPTLLQDGYNGWVIPTADPDALCDALHRMTDLAEDRLAEMSRISRALSMRLSTSGWARHLHEEFSRRVRPRERTVPASTAAA